MTAIAKTGGSMMRTCVLASVLAALIGQTGTALPVAGDFSDWVKTGLLGLVLAWLMLKYLPSKDAQLEKLIADQRAERDKAEAKCAEQRREDNREFIAAIQKQQLDCHAMLTMMMAANDKLNSSSMTAIAKEFGKEVSTALAQPTAAITKAIEQIVAHATSK